MKRFVCWALLLAVGPAHAAQFKFATQTLTVPDGFEVELVAGPPLVNRPIEADFDEEGHLYVTDSSGSNDKPDKQLIERPHRVVRLEDSDGDGRFDKASVFADKMMFPEGALWFQGSFYVGAPPSIWKLTDTNQDGVADIREEWFQGKTLTGCANDMHGPYRGLDGWIYWCKGAFAEQTHPGPNGRPFVTRAAHIFRSRPDGTGIEPVMTGGMDNPVEVAFLPSGERFFTTTFVHRPEAGKRDGVVHAVYGGLYGKANDVLDSHKATGDLMPVMRLFGAAAPCGLMSYRSTAFGPGFQDNLFACLFNLHKVTRHALAPAGATFADDVTDFVTSDNPDFHPTDVLEDADGSLLVIDTGGWYKLCCPTSQLAKPDVFGAIYRIRRKGAPAVADPRGKQINWAKLNFRELAELLNDDRPAVSQRATESLGSRGRVTVSMLAQIARRYPAAAGRRNAVWALTRIEGEQAREAVRLAISDGDPTVSAAASHSAALWRDLGAATQLLKLLESKNLQLQRVAAEALGRIGHRVAVPYLFEALAALEASGHPDRVLEHSLTFALIEIADPTTTATGLTSLHPQVQRAALIAFDQMNDGGVKPEQVTPLLASASPLLKETATWLINRHSDWGTALAGYLRQRLFDTSPSSPAQEESQRLLSRFAGAPEVQILLASAARDRGAEGASRLTALRAMSQAGLKEMPAAWPSALVDALTDTNPEILRAALATARALPLAKNADASELREGLLRVARNRDTDESLRLDALVAAPGETAGAEPEIFSFLRTHADASRPVSQRSSAAAVLARTRLDTTQLGQLTETLQTASPLDVPKLLAAFDRASDEALGLRLVSALRQSKAYTMLRADLIRPRLTNFPDVVRQKGEELIASLNSDAAKQKEHLEAMLGELKGGDIRRGQSIFNSTKAACSSCHAIGYAGGRVGPDLTKIGEVRTERDLLEAILYPSASFVRSYEPLVVVTKSGDSQNGIVRRETPEEVVLVTGPDAEVHIARNDIAEMRPGTISVMPQGLDQQLNRQELADLLAFLKNTRWGPQ